MAVHTNSLVARCDSCHQGMTAREFDKGVECGCKYCSPFVVCASCHEQIKKNRVKEVGFVPDDGGTVIVERI